MARGERPLLARQSSETSSRGLEEEDALLTGRPTNKTRDRNRRYREIGAWTWATLATIVVIGLALAYTNEKAIAEKRKAGDDGKDAKPSGKRNMIFMVSDGMGPTSLELTRSFRQYVKGLPVDDVLDLDQHLLGTSRTRSSNSLVTDSAAGATAFSCGFKSYNGAISVLPDHTPCGTVLEAAKKAGYMTGLVVTTLITDATPACFGSHVQTRSYQDLIAEQLLGYYPLGRMVDLIIGGGRCHFLSNTTEGSCRDDDKDLVAMAKKDGWNYIDNKQDLDNLSAAGGVKLPLLALVAGGNIPFEIDRRHVTDQYPSQYEMAVLALDALKAATQDSDKGFFIMIEGSRIDHAGHNNDPAAQVHEVLMHDKTFTAVLDFLEKDDVPGLLMSTSDHETGGLSAARQLNVAYPQYLWYPGVLANATYSTSYVDAQWRTFLATDKGQKASKKQKAAFITAILSDSLSISDPTQEEIDAVIANGDTADDFLVPPTWLFSDMISRRAQIGWATHGHSGVDVNIYGSHPEGAKDFVGNVENIQVSQIMQEWLDIDVETVTEELKKKQPKTQPDSVAQAEDWDFAWTGPQVSQAEAMGMHADEYHIGSKQ